MPNLFRPELRTARRSPKLSTCAEWIVTLPDPPADAYVSPLGLREIDQAICAFMIRMDYRELRRLTWL
jgi:hypothetical protein